MEQKTLLFYINAIHDGGAERVILQLAERFAGIGYHSVLVTSFVDINEYPVPESVERISIENEQIQQSRLKRNISRIAALRKIIKKYKPAAVISFMGEPNFRALIASMGLPVKTIVSVRNDPEQEYGGRFGRLNGKLLMPTADGCVFQTEQAKSWFSEGLQKKSRIIMNQVNPAFFAVKPDDERRNIVTAGRLSAQKNQKMLIRAYAAIADRTEHDLLIYGVGELEEELCALIKELNMEERIKLMGQSSNVPEDLKSARLFVLPSDFEGMPNALLEAMAMGLCCISTDCPCGGPAAIIASGANGVLIPVGDENALKENMLQLLSDDDKSAAMGKAAKASAESFRPDSVFAQWHEYVESIIN